MSDDRLDLLERDRKEVARILDAMPADIEVWVYGSRISGTAYEMSDLDLVFRGPGLKPIDATVLSSVRDAFSESNIPILVDVFDWAQIPESFRQEILADYFVFR